MKRITSLKISILLFLSIILCGCAGDEKQDDSLSVNVETVEVSTITENSAVISAKVNSNDEKAIVSYGICVSTEINPTVENIKVEEKGNTIGEYRFSFATLKPNTKYYTRGYAITNSGIVYGNELSFTTQIITKPVVSTALPTMITSKTASCGGTILNEGTSAVVGYGVYVSTVNPIPTTTDWDIHGSINSGNFVCKLTNLQPNTKYYVRSYAINNSGISFGDVVSFATEKVGLTSILTNQPSSIFTSAAKVGGTIISDGGSKFTSVGVCVSSVNSVPTTIDAKTDLIGVSESVFQVSLIDLKANTTYYTRAFGINDLGTFYGEVISFTTKKPGVPVLEITNISGLGLNVGGSASIINNGGDEITSYGFVWSKSDNPDITWPLVSMTKTEGPIPNSSSFNGSFTGGIFPNTIHYVRAYATNSYGTGYSIALRFTTGNK